MSSSNPTLTGGPNDVTVHIFVGYAHEDRRWLDPEYRFNLIHFLKESLRRDNVDVWFDKDLLGGDEYRRLIASKIDEAHIALLMVSQHFLNSEFIETFELPRIAARAERKELVVIPVLLERCGWKNFPFLADRQMVPSSSPLIHFTESEPKWADVRFEILEGLQQQVKRIREEMQAKARKETDEERKEREEEERREREERERKEREEKERKEREERERKEKERREREEKERKAREMAEQKAREEAERKAREAAERKKREEQQRREREEKKDFSKKDSVLLAAFRRIIGLVPLACLILAADLVFHLWLGHAGAKWTPLNSGISVAVRAITGSPDGKTLYACGEGTSFLISTDGDTWVNHKTNEPSNCQSIAVSPDGKRILIPAISITGSQAGTTNVTSAILTSIDGGANWQTLRLSDPAEVLIRLAQTSNTSLAPSPGSSSPGYFTFTDLQKEGSLFSAGAEHLLPIQMRGIFSDGTRIMAVGDKGEIFGTKYQASGTWGTDIAAQDSFIRTSLNAVTGTPDGKFVIAVGDNGAILETADWGMTWKSHGPSHVSSNLNAVFMTADGQFICVVGNGGKVLISTDEGEHWTPHYANVLSNLLGVFGTGDGKHLWVVGAGGIILESNDSGATWKQRPSGVNGDLYGIFGTGDGKRLWIAGDDGKILTSKRSLFF